MAILPAFSFTISISEAAFYLVQLNLKDHEIKNHAYLLVYYKETRKTIINKPGLRT